MLEELAAHAADAYPQEACGLVLQHGKRHRLLRAKNVSQHPLESFEIDHEVWLQVADDEEVIGVYHSHPSGLAEPSIADLSACEATNLPWHIIGYQTNDYRRIEPSGFRAPYEKRPYVHGVHDCYAIARDWYNWEWDLGLPDFDRDHEWWNKGGNLYLDNFESCGFRVVEGDPQVGDAFLLQVSSPVPNHVCIYLGEARILHHVEGRLSVIEQWGGFWAKHRTHTLRHGSRCG